MEIGIKVVLLVAAVVCFALAAARVKSPLDFTNAGFALVTASLLA